MRSRKNSEFTQSNPRRSHVHCHTVQQQYDVFGWCKYVPLVSWVCVRRLSVGYGLHNFDTAAAVPRVCACVNRLCLIHDYTADDECDHTISHRSPCLCDCAVHSYVYRCNACVFIFTWEMKIKHHRRLRHHSRSLADCRLNDWPKYSSCCVYFRVQKWVFGRFRSPHCHTVCPSFSLSNSLSSLRLSHFNRNDESAKLSEGKQQYRSGLGCGRTSANWLKCVW